MKRAVLVHAWGCLPTDGWFPWLTRELESRGYGVLAPAMPDADHPHIEPWVRALFETVGMPDRDTVFVGHSMGCQAIVRYCEALPDGVALRGVVFVAGFFTSVTGLRDTPEQKATLDEWLKTPVDFAAAQSHILKSVAIFSDNDPYVPMENQDMFRDQLGSEIVIVPNAGHFSGDGDGTTELPIVLEKILAL